MLGENLKNTISKAVFSYLNSTYKPNEDGVLIIPDFEDEDSELMRYMDSADDVEDLYNTMIGELEDELGFSEEELKPHILAWFKSHNADTTLIQ